MPKKPRNFSTARPRCEATTTTGAQCRHYALPRTRPKRCKLHRDADRRAS